MVAWVHFGFKVCLYQFCSEGGVPSGNHVIPCAWKARCTMPRLFAPRFSKNAPRFRSMHQASFQNAPRKWEMHQAFSEMHQGKRENATGLSHSIKIGVLSQQTTCPSGQVVFCIWKRGDLNPHRSCRGQLHRPVLTLGDSSILFSRPLQGKTKCLQVSSLAPETGAVSKGSPEKKRKNNGSRPLKRGGCRHIIRL